MIIHACDLSYRELRQEDIGLLLRLLKLCLKKEKFLTHCSFVEDFFCYFGYMTPPPYAGTPWVASVVEALYKHRRVQFIPHPVKQEPLSVYR